MDKRIEPENSAEKSIAKLESRVHSAEAAVDHYRNKIVEGEFSDGGEAADLAFKYTAYMSQFWLHSLDLAMMTSEQDSELREKMNLPLLEQLRNSADGAIAKATRGDYTGLKDFLEEMGKDYGRVEKFGGRLSKAHLTLKDKFGNSGSPMKLPDPAWTDPRFSQA